MRQPSDDEKQALLTTDQSRSQSQATRPIARMLGTVFGILFGCAFGLVVFLHKSPKEQAWSELEQHVPLLHVPQITREEFSARQSALGSILSSGGMDGFIAEPSASTAYFANISSSYELSERPFLLLFGADGSSRALVPAFEAGRIDSLHRVLSNNTFITWNEDENPFRVIQAATNWSNIVLDASARYMIAAGLEQVNVSIHPPNRQLTLLRSIKSPHELQILRAINSFTWHLIRVIQKHIIRMGVKQEDIVSLIQDFNERANVPDAWSIVLFGADAASPHGGVARQEGLRGNEFVLIDTGSTLHGYGSDVTRTVLPRQRKSNLLRPWRKNNNVSPFLLEQWQLVHDAQSASIAAMRNGSVCARIDHAARRVIEDAGMGPFFTHRLGHGLGMEMHEEPYLNGANQDLLVQGNVVTNEPGIYVTNSQAGELESLEQRGFGIRLEDALVVTTDGAELLTPSRAKSPWEP